MSSLTPRDVLVGLLAVRRRLIEPEQLDSALLCVARDEADSLAPLLRRWLSDDLWAELFASADQELSSVGSIPALEIPPPHPAATVKDGPRAQDGSPQPGELPEPPPRPPRYTRLSRHAEGGLGVVYLACDEELGRDVALKEIKDRHADRPNSRARFVFEAEVTGRLEHPGIVPVYGLGTYPDGRPYYAMRFIQGHTLAQALERSHQADKAPRHPGERALALRGLLNRFVAVCHAIAYAHSKGIIHRDIKPANVMLGDYGETLVVDWGLAKQIGVEQGRSGIVVPPSYASGEDSGSGAAVYAHRSGNAHTPRSPAAGTEEGAIVGTPNYMPPEQALGDADLVGPRSDVYSLGATLYQLLTGKMPVDEPAFEATLEKVIRGDVPPARQVNPRVPKALEAVCQKAMAVEPADRYATAGDLGDEIERFLADEPVGAYAEPALARARRWARQHRTLVTSGVVLLLASVIGLSLGWWYDGKQKASHLAEVRAKEQETASERDRALAAEKEAKGQRDRAVAAEKRATANLAQAEKNFKLARTAVDECFGLAKSHKLLQDPRAKPIKQLLLDKTLPFYENFRVQRPDDPKLAADQAEYLVRAGYITQQIGSVTKATKHFQDARAVLLPLALGDPNNADLRAKLALACSSLAGARRQIGKLAEATEAAKEAREHFAAACKARPGDNDLESGLAGAHATLGLIHYERGDLVALNDFAQAEAILKRLRKAEPKEPDHLTALATINSNRGLLYRDLGRSAAAIMDLEAARDSLLALLETDPSAHVQYQLAVVSQNLGALLFAQTGRQDEARKQFERSQDLFVLLNKTYPDVTEYRVGLAKTYGIAFVDNQAGKGREALALYQQGRKDFRALTKEHPDVPTYRLDLAIICNDMGLVLRQAGRWDEASATFAEARDVLLKLHEENPEVGQYQTLLGYALNNVGLVEVQRGRIAQASASFDQARAHLEALLKRQPKNSPAQIGLALALNNLAYLNWAAGKPAETIRSCEAARKILAELLEANPRLHQGRHLLAQSHLNEGRARLVRGQLPEATKHLEVARKTSEDLVEKEPNVTDYQAMLATACSGLGYVRNLTGRYEEAARECELARKTFAALLEAQPGAVLYQAGLGTSHFVLALSRLALGDLDKAVEDAERARDVFRALNKDHPDALEFESGLGQAYLTHGTIVMQKSKFAEADASIREAQKLFRSLAKAYPQVIDFKGQLAASCFLRGIVLAALEKPKEARKNAREAEQAFQALAKEQPKNVIFRAGVATSHFCLGMADFMENKTDDGIEEWEQARDGLLALQKTKELLPPHQLVLGLVCRQLAEVRGAKGQAKKAIADYAVARDAFAALAKANPRIVRYHTELATTAIAFGLLYGDEKMPKEARDNLRLARRAALAANRLQPGLAEAQFLQATASALLAYLADDVPDALDLLDEALPLLAAARKAEPTNPKYRGMTREASALRAALLASQKRYREALPDADLAIDLEPDVKKRATLRGLRAALLAHAGEYRAAAESALELAREKGLSAEQYPDLARALSVAAAKAARDAGRPLPEREKNVESWSREAVGLLRRGRKVDLKVVKEEADFAALREREDYKAWLRGKEGE